MIQTSRLSIRYVKQADWRAIREIWMDFAKSDYARYDRLNETDEKSVFSRVTKWASYQNSKEHFFLAVCLKEIVIGYISLHKKEKEYELGYCFHSDYHGYGYAKESLKEVVAYVKEIGGEKIVAGTALENLPSVKLLSSLGFSQVGTERISFYRDALGKEIFFEGGWYEIKLLLPEKKKK